MCCFPSFEMAWNVARRQFIPSIPGDVKSTYSGWHLQGLTWTPYKAMTIGAARLDEHPSERRAIRPAKPVSSVSPEGRQGERLPSDRFRYPNGMGFGSRS